MSQWQKAEPMKKDLEIKIRILSQIQHLIPSQYFKKYIDVSLDISFGGM